MSWLPSLVRRGQGVVGASLQEIAHCQNAQAGELLKRGKITVAGNQGHTMVEAALRNQGVRNLRRGLGGATFLPGAFLLAPSIPDGFLIAVS